MKILFSLLFSIILLSNISYSDTISVFEKWNSLDRKILLKKIDREKAMKLISNYEVEVIKYFHSHNGIKVIKDNWVFPLKNYSSITHRDLGNDYIEDYYDYFDGSESYGHPAHDIFIADSNKDCLDDVTGKSVDVISMSSGVVIATDTTWEAGSILRPGKYIRIYDATNKKVFYYSHLQSIKVKPGDILNAGDKIGEVGRTGRQAVLKEGLTHLHIALLCIVDGYPLPEHIMKYLKHAEERNHK